MLSLILVVSSIALQGAIYTISFRPTIKLFTNGIRLTALKGDALIITFYQKPIVNIPRISSYNLHDLISDQFWIFGRD